MKFQAVVIDPPVPFHTYTGPALPTRRLRQASAASHYTLMSWQDIHGLRPWLDLVAADDCALFLWVCNPHTPEMVKILDSWGFTFKTVAFVWVKLNPRCLLPFSGLGYWTRANTEQLWLATRGKMTRLARDVRQVQEMIDQADSAALRLPRQRHSEKPERFQDEIERLVAGPYLELFARRQRPGWCCLGDEISGRDIREDIERVAALEQPVPAVEFQQQQPTFFDLLEREEAAS